MTPITPSMRQLGNKRGSWMDRGCAGWGGQTTSPGARRGLPEEGHLSQDLRKGQPCEQAEECSKQRGGRCAAFMRKSGPGAVEEGGGVASGWSTEVGTQGE